MVNFLFDEWEPVVRIVVVGVLGYLALVVLLRASGKRTLAQMNSFDFVITVAIGATFGRMLTARSVPLVEAVTAFVLLIGLQFVVSSVQIRWPRFASLITAQPTLLLYGGELQTSQLRRVRVTEDEVRAAVRQHGAGSLDDVTAVVMESTGTLSVIKSNELGDGSLLPRHEPPA
jgi:uncharacterized membrane protein YcaP (DUF421 family)